MKRIIIYGEFINKSTTGIAYMNSNLDYCLKKLGCKVEKILDPRTKDYYESKEIISKKINLYLFIKLIYKLVQIKKHDIAFITLSMNYFGLLKTYLINFLLIIKSKKNYLYIHRGDLNIHYKQSIFKKLLIDLILKQSNKVILLSKIFKDQNIIKGIEKKIVVIPNTLNKGDSLLSKSIYKEKLKINLEKRNKLKIIYSGNIQKEKGVKNILKSIININKQNNDIAYFDLYGMQFEDFNYEAEFVTYKGKIDTDNRLEIMSNYDLFIMSSYSEGLPMVLIECLSIGLPFITSNVGAIQDLLINNYPYICTQDQKSIEEKLKNFIYDFKNRREYINSIISQNNDLFNRNFKYKKFSDNIEKIIR